MFIYLFLVLNVVLLIFFGYTVYQNRVEIVQEKELIERSMKNDNIKIEDNHVMKDSLGYVNVTMTNFRNFNSEEGTLKFEVVQKTSRYNSLKVTSPEVITNIHNVNYQADLENFLTAKLRVFGIYSYLNYDESTKVVNFIQEIDGYKIFDNNNAKVVFKVEEDGDIKELELAAVTNIKKDKMENLATKMQVITKLYHEDKIPKNSTVKANLGYYTYITQVENQVLIPTWQVEVMTDNVKKIYYIDALNIKLLGNTKN